MNGGVHKPIVAFDTVDSPASVSGKTLPSPANALQPLALRSMFWRPNYATDSPWLEHVPFAFWLAEAHRPCTVVEVGSGSPVLYFSFCQAFERLELEGSCVRISGHDPDDAKASAAHQESRAYNASQYSGFSRVEAGDIRAARHQFEDGSIDVMHVAGGDGMLSAEDLADWIPKLSARGVLLLHGSMAQPLVPARRTAGGLRGAQPMFEFAHGDGLTVVPIGAEQPELIKLLCMASGNPNARRAAQEVFFRLGRACADSQAASQERAASQRLKDSIEDYRRRIDLMQAELRNAELNATHRAQEVEAAQQKLDAQLEQRAAERGQLAEKITVLQEARVDLKRQVDALQARLDAASADLVVRAEQAARLAEAGALRDAQFRELQARTQALEQLVQQKEAERLALASTAQEKEAQRAALAAQAERAEQAVDRLTKQFEESVARHGNEILLLRQQLTAQEQLHAQHQARAAQVADEVAQQRRQLEQEIATLTGSLERAAREQRAARDERDALERQVGELQASARQSDARLGVAHQELADLTRFLAEAEQKLAHAEERAAVLPEKEQELQAALQARAQLAQEVQEYHRRTSVLYARLAVLQKELGKATERAGGGRRGARGEAGEAMAQACETIRKSGLFDAEWYLKQYPDVAATKMDPLQHFVRHGASELRDPGPFFSTAAYVAANRARLSEGDNPLLHHLAGEAGEQDAGAAQKTSGGVA